MASSVNEPPKLLIESGRASRQYWSDIWRYRDLLYFLAWRDIKVRYKQAALGAAWALIQPIVTTALFTFVFGKLARMPMGDLPTEAYPVLVLAGLLPWQLFSAAFSGASASLVSNGNLITKVYFPRLVVPLSALAVAVVDFGIVIVLYAILAAWFDVVPPWQIVFLPLFIGGALLLALGAGLWLSALTVKYRDFRFIVPFLLQVGVFATPVGYRTDTLHKWRDVLAFNPLTGIVDGFRCCLIGRDFTVEVQSLVISAAGGLVLLATGIWYFRRMERQIADII